MNRGAAELTAEFAIEGEGFGIANGTAALRPEQARQNAFTLGENEHATVTLSFEPSSLGESAGRLVLTSNDPAHARMEFALSGVGVEIPPTPMISAGGVVDAAQFQPVVARGGIGSIFGGNLADGDRVGYRGLRPGTLPHHRTYGFPYPAVGPGGLPACREIRWHHESVTLQITF